MSLTMTVERGSSYKMRLREWAYLHERTPWTGDVGLCDDVCALLAEVEELRVVLQPFVAYPRWLSIGSSNTVSVRVSAEKFQRACHALKNR